MSDESIENPLESNDSFAPSLIDYRPLADAKCSGNC